MARFEIEVRAVGRYAPTAELITSLGEVLEATPGLIDPILSADLASGAVDLSVEVEALDEVSARGRAAEALGAAMVASGSAGGWSVVARGEIAIV